ncbi:hypothetical protein [Hydrogenimonas sp.]
MATVDQELIKEVEKKTGFSGSDAYNTAKLISDAEGVEGSGDSNNIDTRYYENIRDFPTGLLGRKKRRIVILSIITSSTTGRAKGQFCEIQYSIPLLQGAESCILSSKADFSDRCDGSSVVVFVIFFPKRPILKKKFFFKEYRCDNGCEAVLVSVSRRRPLRR